MKKYGFGILLSIFIVAAVACTAGLVYELWYPYAAERSYQEMRAAAMALLQDEGELRNIHGIQANEEKMAATENTDDAPEITGGFADWSDNMVAWLTCPDTGIDYPVMQWSDNDYYLEHLPDGSRNRMGSLFLDCGAAADFSSPVSVIYGHNVKKGGMFHELTGYKDVEFYQEHPYFTLLTVKGEYRIQIVAAYLEDGLHDIYPAAFEEEADWQAYWEHVSETAFFVEEEDFSYGDKLVILSTCSYEFEQARLAVVGVLAD